VGSSAVSAKSTLRFLDAMQLEVLAEIRTLQNDDSVVLTTAIKFLSTARRQIFVPIHLSKNLLNRCEILSTI